MVLTMNAKVQRETEQAIMRQLEKLRNTPVSRHGAPYDWTGYEVAMEGLPSTRRRWPAEGRG
ncbi:hypothetical protein [Paenibacillus methanolicus]|uniref:Uncharacterized protein n=1 Tax=Paenibacillus methanolicus TaxID=582686 RepID=A0A5S5CHL0_9BACL|nr:hypothetical protein [Paenibacillus methanolicus]TYP79250.1 hypothetical protein BCM02_101368 [Paenibacillus methanolicus]